MNINVLKTKVRLTKSIVNQMQFINFEELKTAVCIGYVANVDKNTNRMLLFVTDKNEYRKTYWDWARTGNFNLYRRHGRYSMESKFPTTYCRDTFYNLVRDAQTKANQIYI